MKSQEYEELVPSSKRRRGFPSETHVKRGFQDGPRL
jgi:hypothetical protein